MRKLPSQLTMRKATEPKASGLRFVRNAAAGATDIYLYDEIGFWGITAQDFVDRLNEVDSKKINLHVNSPGGEIFDGLAIFNAIKQHPAEVTVYVDALAASAASFIAQAGDKIIMTRNAVMMIHDGIGLAYGNEEDMLETAALLGKLSDNIADIYAYRAGGTVAEWRALMREEVWYSSAEAVEAGLADERLDEDDEEAEAETNKWDFSIFNYAGRDEAPSPNEIRKRVLTNRVKEAPVATGAKNQGGTTEPSETATTGTDGTQTDDTQGTPPEQSTTQPANEPNPAGNGNTDDEENGNGEGGQQTTEPTNRAGLSVLINGTRTSDLSAIQNHINSLETFRTETIDAARRGFVENLSQTNRIPATQITKLTNLVLSFSDEQYADFVASYEDVPSQPMFQQHGVTPGDSGAPVNNEARALTDEITSLEQIVADHRRTGMSEEVLKTKASYQRLQTLKSQHNNNA